MRAIKTKGRRAYSIVPEDWPMIIVVPLVGMSAVLVAVYFWSFVDTASLLRNLADACEWFLYAFKG